jgi:hypothetical protein
MGMELSEGILEQLPDGTNGSSGALSIIYDAVDGSIGATNRIPDISHCHPISG